MATIGNTFLSLIDMYKGTGGTNAQIGEVIEVLRQLNPLMEDAVTAEANMGTYHRHTIRTGLPTVTWGMLYQGIPQSKSSTQQVDDTTGFVEGLSTVDTRLLDISPNPAAVRLSEGRAYLEAMAQEVQRGFFYHDITTTPEKFRGLSARYNKLGGGGAGNQII
ncbi:MAG: major capsid protein, partial [Sphingomonas sp.]